MRLLLDTCIVVFMTFERDRLSADVDALLSDYDNQLYTSMETIRELIVAYRRKGLGRRLWKSEDEILPFVRDELGVVILPFYEEHMQTYARLVINEQQGHLDPSDHIIIAHAITENIPLISSDHKFDFYKKQGLEYICNAD